MKNKIAVTLIFFLVFISTYVLAAVDKTIHYFGATKQTLSPSTGTIKAGYYDSTTLQQVDTDLAEGNIKDGICIFNTTGTLQNHELPDTGQFKCYNATVEISPPLPGQPFYGQDAQYNPIVSSPSYTDNGDGTVTDNNTGLMWVANSTDTAVGGAGIGKCTWEVALSTCVWINVNGGYAGYTDWRLPNIRELQSIVDYNRNSPSLNRTYFKGIFSDNYWSSSTHINVTLFAWFVDFIDGNVGNNNKGQSCYVRPVRGGQ